MQPVGLYLHNSARYHFVLHPATVYDSSFSTGITFYYWPYFKNKLRLRHNHGHINHTHTPKELYISPKYESIKDETLNNNICTIKFFSFKEILKKAKRFMDTNRARSLRSSSDSLLFHYGIKAHSPLSIENLLCIILYCDWSDFCTAFSSTFRRTKSFEPLSSVKTRNREFWHFSKTLRETVELYGEHKGFYDKEKKKWSGIEGPFYCGMSFKCVLSSFNIRLQGPTSTSKQIAVATRFGGDHGIIIQLNNSGDWNSEYLRCFDCSWISNYNSEEERLFFGGRYRMKVESIRIIDTQQDFASFFHALFYFDCMLNGSAMSNDTDKEINKLDWLILERLIKHELSVKTNKFDQYVNKTFALFCKDKRQIVLNLHQIELHFEKFRYLVFMEHSNLFTDVLFKLFKNLNAITIITTNRIPYVEYCFALQALGRLLESELVSDDIRVIVKADCDALYDYDTYNRSWISEELWNRRPLDRGKYIVELKTKHIKNRYPLHEMMIYKR